MQYFGFDRPSFGIKTFGFGSSEFSPLDLFAGGKQGVWYDPSDKSTLFQDVAGTVPVTKDGDPVALMRDKSGNGNHATQTVSTSRPIYKTDGVLHWLSLDGVDDQMLMTGLDYISGSFTFFSAFRRTSAKTANVLFSRYGDTRSLLLYTGSTGSRVLTRADAVNQEGGISVGSDYVLTVINSQSSNTRGASVNGVKLVGAGVYDNGGLPSTTPMVLGGTSSGFDNPLGGHLYGVIFIIDDVSSANKTTTEHYMANKSGVTL